MNEDISIEEERISSKEYVDFLKRTDLGTQYPQERFDERVEKLVNNVQTLHLLFTLPVCFVYNTFRV